MLEQLRSRLEPLDEWLLQHRWTRMGRAALIGFLRHDTVHYAGSMAYFAMLSVFQLLILAIVIISSLLDEGATRELLLSSIGPGSPLDRETVADLIDGTLEARGSLTVVSFVFLVWSALGMFAAISRGVRRAFDEPQPRHLFWDQIRGLMLMATTGGLVVAAVVIGLATGALQRLAGAGVIGALGGSTVVAALGLIAPIVLVFGAFWVLYRVVPGTRIGWRGVLPGAIAATLMWTALRFGFTFYVTNLASYDTAFGPIATGLTFLLFLYLASIVVLVGAEIAHASATDGR